jgi:cytochrome P450
MDSCSPVIDFDHHTPYFKENWPQIARELHAMDFPLAWTDAHEGFWVLASWEEAKRITTDYENFSSDNDVNNEREGFRGVAIPRQPFQLMLSESDPPLSVARRRLEMPFFTPKSLRTWGPTAEAFFREALDACAGREEVDLVHDIVIPTTARTTLNLVGFEADNWRDAAMSSHRAIYLQPDDADYPHAEMAGTQAMFSQYLAARRAEPKEDIISALAHGKVSGEPLTDQEAESMMYALIFGGFDTTTAAVVNALIWLAKRPEARAALVASPQAMTLGIDEFLRFFPPTSGVVRNARHDMEIHGRKILRGDRIFCWLGGANRDPKKFAAPDTLDLSRSNAPEHLSFSSGPHRCLGAPLAKLEIAAMLETFIREIPNYSIDDERIVSFPLVGAILGFSSVPVRLHAGATA